MKVRRNDSADVPPADQWAVYYHSHPIRYFGHDFSRPAHQCGHRFRE
jgi:hypothetical protein